MTDKPKTDFQNWGSKGSEARPAAVGPHDPIDGGKTGSVRPEDYKPADGGNANGPGKGPKGPVNIGVKK